MASVSLQRASDSGRDRGPVILLIETDEVLAQRMAEDLETVGYCPAIAADARSGLNRAIELDPALIAVDRLLSGESGLWFCHRLRDSGNVVPVILLVARDSVEDRVSCLEAGADDYFLKPYRADDFLSLIRLYLHEDSDNAQQLRFGDLTLELGRRRAVQDGKIIDLTMKEFELLRYLMEHPREVLAREQILENVWGYDFMGESNVIEVYIRYLRLKLEAGGLKRIIQTVRGVGYVLRET